MGKLEIVSDFIFLGSKITADGDYSHEIKRCLLLGRKAMSNVDSILKSRDITLPTRFHTVKAMIFPLFMYECESRTIKKSEHCRSDAFELWCWRRLLRVPWPASPSNQSILKEISSEYSLERLMLKLKLNPLATWCQELTWCWKRPWWWERLKAGGERDNRGRDLWMASLTQWTWVWVNSGDWWWIEKPGTLSPLCHKELDTTEQLNWSEIVIYYIQPVIPSFIFLSCYILILLINILFMDTWVILGTVTWTLGDYSLS